jgi:hypothetical protein
LNKSRRLRWKGYVACTEEMRNAYQILAGKSGGKRPHGTNKSIWKDNIKKNFKTNTE